MHVERKTLRFWIALSLSGAINLAIAQTQSNEHWVGTWATAAIGRPQTAPAPAAPPQTGSNAPTSTAQQPPPPLVPKNQTLREIVHTSIGGTRVRVVFTNAFGTAPLKIGAAGIALKDKDSKIVADSKRALMFSGRASVTIPAGATLFSDAVDENVPAMGDLAIDVFVPEDAIAPSSPITVHTGAYQTNYASSSGNFVGAPDMPGSTNTPSWYFLARVEVVAAPETKAVVAFGDSITDGTRSTAGANARWPDQLAKRLLTRAGGVQFGMLNAAIAGNRLLSEGQVNFGINALARFDRDVLAQTGATHVVVLEGINDIGMTRPSSSLSAADLIAAHEQMVERAHAHGLKILGATLTPFEGAAYFTAEGEEKRQAFNNWMRSNKKYDGVIDFDSVIRDPEHPAKFQPAYDSGDHLHPNDAGYEAMAKAIELSLFAPSARAVTARAGN